MNKFCIICGKLLIGRQRSLCSDIECHKERKREISHKYCQDNPEKVKESCRKYYQDNQEKITEYNRDYYQDNREEIRKHKREYYQDNQTKIRENSRDYYQDNREKTSKYKREYYQNNREEKLDYERKQYRLLRGLPEDTDLYKESSIEHITREWLQENGVKFIKQYYINLKVLGANWTHVDFFIEPNICLYSDGDYYHRPKDIQERDIRIDRALETGGYNVIRITETEILEGNRVWCRLAQYLSKYGVNIK